ncbi:MAG: TRAP transporter large permease, partial [Alphaproteobacteria bacterium]|nr:TRAP transporter large permease [Alphaproteobacteria bacterium]
MGLLILFAMVIVLLAIGVPIAVSLGLSSVVFLLIYSDSSLASVAQTLFSAFEGHYTLLAIPFFILASSFMATGGVARRIIRFAIACVGHFPGGLAIAGVFACMLFAALSGSSPATVVAIGTIVIAGMVSVGYTKDFAAGVICNAGTLGILIPPSVVLVIFAIAVEANIVTLFQAALVPGILAALGYVLAISIYVRVKPEAGPVGHRAERRERLRALVETWPVILIFAIVIGGIYAGVFHPTEGAAFGAFGTAVIAFWRGGLRLDGFIDCVRAAAVSTGMIFMILMGADFFNAFLGFSRMPLELADWISASGLSPIAVLMLMIGIYLLLGCVMDSLAMILLTVP